MGIGGYGNHELTLHFYCFCETSLLLIEA
jgi:hypothetical protein